MNPNDAAPSVEWIAFISAIWRLGFGVFAALALFGALRFFDRLSGVDWSTDVWKVMVRDPQALSDYYGKRFLGVCVVVAGFLVSG